MAKKAVSYLNELNSGILVTFSDLPPTGTATQPPGAVTTHSPCRPVLSKQLPMSNEIEDVRAPVEDLHIAQAGSHRTKNQSQAPVQPDHLDITSSPASLAHLLPDLNTKHLNVSNDATKLGESSACLEMPNELKLHIIVFQSTFHMLSTSGNGFGDNEFFNWGHLQGIARSCGKTWPVANYAFITRWHNCSLCHSELDVTRLQFHSSQHGSRLLTGTFGMSL